MSQQTKQILNYTVRQGDQLERIALKYMGDASNWVQIAILNSLDYPYISDDLAFVRLIKATGTVTFRRTVGTVGAIVIPIGASVYVPATVNAPARYYVTDAACTILNGTDTIDQAISAVAPGELWNTPSLTVTGLNFTVTNLGSVKNSNPITGGAVLNVKLPGETLMVYTDATGATGTIGVNTKALQGESFYAALLGTDIGLDKNGDLQADSRGGLALVSGLSNLRDAVRHRLQTSLAWYVYYPSYGTGMEKAIGQRGDEVWMQWAAVEAERTVRSDPRVANVQNMKVAFQHGILTLNFDITAIGENSPTNLVVALNPAGGLL